MARTRSKQTKAAKQEEPEPEPVPEEPVTRPRRSTRISKLFTVISDESSYTKRRSSRVTRSRNQPKKTRKRESVPRSSATNTFSNDWNASPEEATNDDPSVESGGAEEMASSTVDFEADESVFLDASPDPSQEETPTKGSKKFLKAEPRMTARQRSILENRLKEERGEAVVNTISSPVRKVTETEEGRIRKQILNNQRKLRKDEQLKETKNSVIQRLLYKQTPKSENKNGTQRAKSFVPHVRYISNYTGVTLSYAAGFDHPLSKKC